MYIIYWENGDIMAIANSKEQLQRLLSADFDGTPKPKEVEIVQDERCDCDGFCTGMCHTRHPDLEKERTLMGKLPSWVTKDTPIQQVIGFAIGDTKGLAKADFR